MAEEQALATGQPGALNTAVVDDFDYGDDRGQGFENQSMADRKLPVIELLQSNSPSVVRGKGKVWAGMFRNTVTDEVMEQILFIPAITDHCFTEWLPRDDGGGFRGRHRKDSAVVREAIARNNGRSIGRLPVPQPNDKSGKVMPAHELVETFEIYALLLSKDGEVAGIGLIPFASTKIKEYRTWNTRIANFAPTLGGRKFSPGEIPIFAHRVALTSIDSPAGGQYDFKLPALAPANGGDDLKNSLLPPKDLRYQAAKKLHDDVKTGLARAVYENASQDVGEDREADVGF